MKKVVIIGSGGAGKSTFARRLGEMSGIEVFHLDKLYWKPNWTKTPKDEWAKIVENSHGIEYTYLKFQICNSSKAREYFRI